jgi:hypothetical protein
VKALRRIALTFASLIALGVAYFGFQLITAEARVRPVCESIKPGTPASQLREIAQANGLGPRSFPENGTSFIVEQKTYGRFGCKVDLDAGIVKQVDYHVAD